MKDSICVKISCKAEELLKVGTDRQMAIKKFINTEEVGKNGRNGNGLP